MFELFEDDVVPLLPSVSLRPPVTATVQHIGCSDERRRWGYSLPNDGDEVSAEPVAPTPGSVDTTIALEAAFSI